VRLIVQDLTTGMASPCVMDIKMGIRTSLEVDVHDNTPRPDLLKKMDAINPREAKSDERKAGGVTKHRYLTYRDNLTSTSTLGYRVDAAVVTKHAGKERTPLSYNFRELKDEGKIKKCMADFLQQSKMLAKAVLIKLERMRSALERSDYFKGQVFVRSSILITYDYDIFVEHNKTGGTPEDFISMTGPIPLEVKMIDFAQSHPTPNGEKLTHRAPWTPGNHEDGYLTGMDSLITLLGTLSTSLKQ